MENDLQMHGRAIHLMTAYADREVCRLCNECMSHCEKGVQIADKLATVHGLLG